MELKLPGDARRADQEGDDERDPGTGPQERAPERCEQDGAEHGGAEQDDAELGEEADAAGGAEGEPPPEFVAALLMLGAKSSEREQGQRPRELIEDDRLEETAGPEEERARDQRQRREPLRPAPAAELAGNHAGKQDQCGGGESGDETDGGERVAEQGASAAAEHGDERWEVHGPDPEVLAHGEVEQLVPVKTPGTREIDADVEREDEGRERGDDWRHPRPRHSLRPERRVRCPFRGTPGSSAPSPPRSRARPG